MVQVRNFTGEKEDGGTVVAGGGGGLSWWQLGLGFHVCDGGDDDVARSDWSIW